jgi:valyl-tRNA synthetase
MRFIPPIIEALERGIRGHTIIARSLGPEKMSKSKRNTVDPDEIIGRRMFNNTCRMIRAILYRDSTMRLALGGLSETIAGSTERVKMYDVTKQDYLSGRNTDGDMTYLCTTEMVFVTETVRN